MPAARMPRRRSVPMFELLESRCLMSGSPASVVHDGGGTALLTSSMIQSGQTYENYLIRSTLGLTNFSNVTITDCNVTNVGNSIIVSNDTDLSIVGNAFSGAGIAGGGDLIGCHFDNNTFSGTSEPIHLVFGVDGKSSNVTVNNNYMPNYDRIGIELQDTIHGLQVTNNYIAQSSSVTTGTIAISCATGAQPPYPSGEPDSTGVVIANNIILGRSSSLGAAIESYGSGNTIENNYASNWNSFVIYTATAVSGDVPWYMTDNTIINCATVAGCEGFGPNLNPTLSANSQYANAASAPAVPAWSATSSSSASSTPVVSAPAVATPTGLTATADSDGVALSWQAVSGASYVLTGTATQGTQTQTFDLPAGTTSYTDTSVPADTEVNYTIIAVVNGVSSTPSGALQVQTPATTVIGPVAATVNPPQPAPAGTIPATPSAAPVSAAPIPMASTQTAQEAIPLFDGPLP